jgi:predicted secreted protein
MAKRLALCCGLFVLACTLAAAGDIAQFVDLGFSPDSKYFMFAQYGVQESDSHPYAEAFIVDVKANAFVPQGARKASYSQPVEPGVSPIGALVTLVGDLSAQKKQYKIDHLVTGRILYLLVDGAAASNTLEFRDFQNERKYKIDLLQPSTEGLQGAGSSFHLVISVEESSGKVLTFTAGDPTFVRKGVRAYHISQVILAPDSHSLVFVIQREEQDTNGNNIRYMVETVKVN